MFNLANITTTLANMSTTPTPKSNDNGLDLVTVLSVGVFFLLVVGILCSCKDKTNNNNRFLTDNPNTLYQPEAQHYYLKHDLGPTYDTESDGSLQTTLGST